MRAHPFSILALALIPVIAAFPAAPAAAQEPPRAEGAEEPARAQEIEAVTRSQKRAVEEFLGAVASGRPEAVAYAIHPAALETLRTRILDLLRSEEDRGDFTVRARLFGRATRVAELERLTPNDFYALLGRKLVLVARPYQDARYLGAIRDAGDVVHVVLKGEPPEGRGKVKVVNLVSIVPYGRDWKAALPSEIEAQIDDLVHGRAPPAGMLVPGGPRAEALRTAALAAGGAAAPAPAGAAGGAGSSNPPAILELLDAAEKDLTSGDCEAFYRQRMSPNFRKVTSKKALEALIGTCQRDADARERLISTMRILRSLSPRFQYEGTRAVYDVSNQGLPYDRMALEQVDKRWYIAE